METLSEVPGCLQVYLHYVYRDYKEKPVDSYCTFNKHNNNITFVLAVSFAFKVLASDRLVVISKSSHQRIRRLLLSPLNALL